MSRAVLVAAGLFALVAMGLLLIDGGAWLGVAGEAPDSADRSAGEPSLRASDGPGLVGHAAHAAGATVASPEAAPYVPPKGALAGRVLGPSGRPVAGAEIYLQPAAPTGTPFPSEWTLLEFLQTERVVRALSDATGCFAIPDAPDGATYLVAYAEGFGMRAERVRLRGGQAVGGPIDLMLGTGRRFKGRVVDHHGEGVAGISVAFVTDLWRSALELVSAVAVSGADGRYVAWAGIADGESGVVAYARPDVAALVSQWGVRGGEIHWPAFVDATLRFVAGEKRVPLEALAFSTSSWGGDHERPMCRVWSVTDGEAGATVPLLAGVLQGAWGRHPRTGSFGLDSRDIIRAATNEAVVPAGREASLEVLVREERSAATLVGTVRDAAGRAIADARVVHSQVHPSDVTGVFPPRVISGGRGLLAPPRESRTDADGRYAFAVEASRAWGYGSLAVRAPGYAPLDVGCPAVADAKQDGPRRVDVTLTRGARLTGRVLDDHGRPLVGAEVRTDAHAAPGSVLVAAFGDLGSTSPGAAMAAVTGADGSYVLRGLPFHADVAVRARHRAGLGMSVVNIHVDHRAVQTAPDIRLAPCGSLRVRVLGPGGLVRGGAAVLIVNGADSYTQALDHRPVESRERTVVTGEDGEGLLRHLPEGGHCLLVTAEGTAGAALPVVIEPGRVSQEVTVRLRRSALVRGIVLDHKGRPVPALELAVFHPSGTDVTSPAQWLPLVFPTNRDARKGHFSIDTVPHGVPVRIYIESGHFQPSEVVVRGGGPPVEVVLQPWDAALLERMEAVAAQRAAIQKKHGPRLDAAMAGDADLAAKVRALETEAERLQAKLASASGADASCGGSGRG